LYGEGSAAKIQPAEANGSATGAAAPETEPAVTNETNKAQEAAAKPTKEVKEPPVDEKAEKGMPTSLFLPYVYLINPSRHRGA
jgi:hypothetical protein